MGRAVMVVVVGSPPVLSIRKWRKEIRNQNAAYYSFFVTVRNTSATIALLPKKEVIIWT